MKTQCIRFLRTCGLALVLALALNAEANGLSLKLVAEGFTSPTVLTPLNDGSDRLLIADQIGTVHVLNKDGTLADKLFLDLRSRLIKLNEGFDERGILGLALHPNFRENRKFYVYYSAPLQDGGRAEWDHTSHISEFKVTSEDRALADHASERVILKIDQPYFNHNSGRLAFGPDNYLYIASGDGGNANDVGRRPAKGNGQDLTTLLGKILRIDVNNGNPYAVPADNPFRDGKNKARPEIFAYGLRNPWGISFDGDQLFAVDVGQTLYEELNIITKGGNYGWNLHEGRHCFDPKNPKKSPPECPQVGADGKPLIKPVAEYKNVNGFRKDPEALGISVTGGYVYRGKAIPSLQGRYVFADWSSTWALPNGVVLAATKVTKNDWKIEPLKIDAQANGKIKAYVVALGEDKDGELYFLTNGRNSLVGKTGKVYKLVP